MSPVPAMRLLTLSAQLGMIATLILWFGIMAPSALFGPWLAVVWVTPLLLPLPGLLRGRSYTYAWNSLLLMLYVCLGMAEVAGNPAERPFSYTLLLCTALAFIGCQLYVRGKAAAERREGPVHDEPQVR